MSIATGKILSPDSRPDMFNLWLNMVYIYNILKICEETCLYIECHDMIVQDYYLDSEVNIEIWIQIQCENIPEIPLKHITQIIFLLLRVKTINSQYT